MAWLQSSIAKWRWLPKLYYTRGAVFPLGPEPPYYKPSLRSFHWGRWIWTWQTVLFEVDRLPDGSETVVNGYACTVRHWKWNRG